MTIAYTAFNAATKKNEMRDRAGAWRRLASIQAKKIPALPRGQKTLYSVGGVVRTRTVSRWSSVAWVRAVEPVRLTCMGRVTLQEFRLADLHTTSTTARHGSEKFRVHTLPDSCHRRLKHTTFVLLIQRPSVYHFSIMAAVMRDVAKRMPTVAKQIY